MSPIATLAPSLCSAVAVASPIPRAPPVITMTLPRTLRPIEAVSAMCVVLPQILDGCQLCDPVSTALGVARRNNPGLAAPPPHTDTATMTQLRAAVPADAHAVAQVHVR